MVLDAKQTTEDFILADFLAFKYVWSILKLKTSKTEISDCVPASIAKEARGCVPLGQGTKGHKSLFAKTNEMIFR